MKPIKFVNVQAQRAVPALAVAGAMQDLCDVVEVTAMYRRAQVLYKAKAWDYNRVRKVVGMFHHFSGILRPRRWRGPAMAQPNYLSREGLEKLQAELEYLRTVRRHDVAASIQQSRERGGTVSNAEYEESKNELAFTEGRILTLDNLINNAVIIDENRGAADIVEVGAIVTVENQDGKNYEYTITGSASSMITIKDGPGADTYEFTGVPQGQVFFLNSEGGEARLETVINDGNIVIFE